MEDKEVSDLLNNYQKVLKMFQEHVKSCPSLKKKIMKEFKDIE